MKKLVSLITVFCMVLALSSCAEKVQSVTYRSETEQDGLKMTDTMTLDAKGDTVEAITETIEMDLSAFDEQTRQAICSIYDELVVQYRTIEGVEGSGETKEGTYIMHISIDATGDAVSELAEQGLLEVDGNTNGISLKKTGESLEANGFTLVE